MYAAACLDAVPGDRSMCQRRTLVLCLDPGAVGGGVAPRQHEQHGTDAAAEIGDARRLRGYARSGEPGGDQIIERPAMSPDALQDAPIAGEVAEIFASLRPDVVTP